MMTVTIRRSSALASLAAGDLLASSATGTGVELSSISTILANPSRARRARGRGRGSGAAQRSGCVELGDRATHRVIGLESHDCHGGPNRDPVEEVVDVPVSQRDASVGPVTAAPALTVDLDEPARTRPFRDLPALQSLLEPLEIFLVGVVQKERLVPSGLTDTALLGDSILALGCGPVASDDLVERAVHSQLRAVCSLAPPVVHQRQGSAHLVHDDG